MNTLKKIFLRNGKEISCLLESKPIAGLQDLWEIRAAGDCYCLNCRVGQGKDSVSSGGPIFFSGLGAKLKIYVRP